MTATNLVNLGRQFDAAHKRYSALARISNAGRSVNHEAEDRASDQRQVVEKIAFKMLWEEARSMRECRLKLRAFKFYETDGGVDYGMGFMTDVALSFARDAIRLAGNVRRRRAKKR